MTALLMRDLGVREVYVKVVSHDRARLIEKIGVTETIFRGASRGSAEDARSRATSASRRTWLHPLRAGARSMPEIWHVRCMFTGFPAPR
jgi:trk system potassium uptake protein TrkA